MTQKEAIERLVSHKKYLTVLFNGHTCSDLPTNVPFEVYRRESKIYAQIGDSVTVEDILSLTDKIILLENAIEIEQEYEKSNPNLIKALKAHFECQSKR